MTALLLPADGRTVWRVTSRSGVRHLRLRSGGHPLALPAGTLAEPVLTPDLDAEIAAAPADLTVLWQLAEAQHPHWGWSVWRLGHEPLAWSLLIEPPDGSQQRYTWVRRSGRMVPVCAVETARAPAATGTAG